MYVLLDDKVVLGGNCALVEAELLAGAVEVANVAASLVKLVRLVHSLICPEKMALAQYSGGCESGPHPGCWQTKFSGPEAQSSGHEGPQGHPKKWFWPGIQGEQWYHCDDKHITETNLLTLSNNVYLMFYAKEVDLST